MMSSDRDIQPSGRDDLSDSSFGFTGDLPAETDVSWAGASGGPMTGTVAEDDYRTGSTDSVEDDISFRYDQHDTGAALSDKASSVQEAAQEKAASAQSSVKGWISEHPLIAVGLGLVGGMVLGGRGGSDDDKQDRHQWSSRDYSYYDASIHRPSHVESSGTSYGGTGEQPGKTTGLVGLAQHTGLAHTLQDATQRLLRTANDQVATMARQNVPGFEEKLRERQSEGHVSAQRSAPSRQD